MSLSVKCPVIGHPDRFVLVEHVDRGLVDGSYESGFTITTHITVRVSRHVTSQDRFETDRQVLAEYGVDLAAGLVLQ